MTAYNSAVSTYSLARLEVAAFNPSAAAPPVLNRVASLRAMEEDSALWLATVRSVREVGAFVGAVGRGEVRIRRDRAWTRFVETAQRVAEVASEVERLRTLYHGAPGSGRAQ